MRPLYWFKKRKQAGMTPVSEVMLDMIIDKKIMTVMDLAHIAVGEGIASHSTVHNNLAWLKEHGYVKTQVNREDERSRMCVPTEKAKRYLGVKHVS